MKYIIKESHYVYLLENLDKRKRLFIDLLGEDLINSIQKITSAKELPIGFLRNFGTSTIQTYIDTYGSLYYFVFNGEPFIYKDRISPKGEEYEMYINDKGESFFSGQIPNRLGLSDVGLEFSDVIDAFHNEGEPLNESVDKNKKFLINIMGEDLTGKIKEIKDGSDIPKRFHRYLELGNVKQQIDMVGPMYLVKIRGNYYLYQDQSHFYQSHNDASFGEQFMSEDGKRDRSGKILKELGLDELGLRFSDIIDIFYNEGEPLNENVEKNKKFLTNLMGVDFTDKIQQITSSYDVPMSFDEGVSPGVSPELIRRWLNHWGPMYLVNIKGKKYLYQDRGEYEFFMDEHGYDYVDDEILEQLGIDELGLKFSDIIDIFFNEEETLNEGIDMSQNLKVKKLLQNLLENKDFNISFEDEEYVYALGADYEELVYTPYEFKFHMIVKKVYGEGSNTIAKIDVIIDDIQKDNEDFYDEWVSDGYNEDVWYIEELGDKIKQELLEDLPFSIYLTFYGYDEVNSHF